jgi:hypothetical protein
MFEVGKVPLTATFSDLDKGFAYQIEQNVVEADYFKVFNKAQVILPKNTPIAIQDYTTLIYNNYFDLTYYNLPQEMPQNIPLQISVGCDLKNEKIILQSGVVDLCQI